MGPRRLAVLLNPAAGSADGSDGDALRDALDSAFRARAVAAGIEFLGGSDLRAGAERALGRVRGGELDAIVVGGGDGTISTVAGVLAGSGAPLGILPLGTLNHFARDLGIPAGIEDAIDIITAGEVREVDVGELNGRVFINNSSIGIYPYLVLDRERRTTPQGLPKPLATVLSALRALRHFPVRRVVIRLEGRVEEHRSVSVFVGNNRYGLSGASLGRRERLDEGVLGVHVARQKGKLALLWLAARALAGGLDEPRDLGSFEVTGVEIASGKGKVLVALDGEVDLLDAPLRYRIRPGALRVFAPR